MTLPAAVFITGVVAGIVGWLAHGIWLEARVRRYLKTDRGRAVFQRVIRAGKEYDA